MMCEDQSTQPTAYDQDSFRRFHGGKVRCRGRSITVYIGKKLVVFGRFHPLWIAYLWVSMQKSVAPDTLVEYHLNRHQPEKLQFVLFDLREYLAHNYDKAGHAHTHSFYQIIWFKSGKGKHYVDFKEYEVIDKAMFFIAKDQVHYFDRGRDYDGVLIHFNESFLVQNDDEVDFFLKCSLFNNPYQQPSCCIGQGIEPILDDYIRQIRLELGNPRPWGQDELLRAYLKAFLIQVQRKKNEFEEKQGKQPFVVNEKRLQLIEFINLIDVHYKKGLSVAEYAEKLHLSPRSLSDLTHQNLNKTPSLMIQERI